jgi:hypothetical protein
MPATPAMVMALMLSSRLVVFGYSAMDPEAMRWFVTSCLAGVDAVRPFEARNEQHARQWLGLLQQTRPCLDRLCLFHVDKQASLINALVVVFGSRDHFPTYAAANKECAPSPHFARVSVRYAAHYAFTFGAPRVDWWPR